MSPASCHYVCDWKVLSLGEQNCWLREQRHNQGVYPDSGVWIQWCVLYVVPKVHKVYRVEEVEEEKKEEKPEAKSRPELEEFIIKPIESNAR